MGIQYNLSSFRNQLPAGIKLVAVSKTKPVNTIEEVYNAGLRCFGENKVQELVEKQALLPDEIEWHFIGHLQRNKVKFIAPFVSLIHAVDSLKLLNEVNKHASNNDRIINCLLQFHIAKESTKFGLNNDEAIELLESDQFNSFKHVNIIGVMGMATFTNNTEQVRFEFRLLKTYFNEMKEKYFSEKEAFREISMGMSDDYKTAIEEGSTMLRIGTKIFGEREMR